MLSMSQASAPVFIRMLRNLKAELDKAAAHAAAQSIDPELLCAWRLHPTMLPLSAQVQIACDTAKRCLARLSGVEAPAHADTERTLEELKARIDSTLGFLKTVPAVQLDGTEDKPVKLELPGLSLDFTGQQYLLSFALPNFFFHVVTAHDILRQCGVDVGKRDYMGAP